MRQSITGFGETNIKGEVRTEKDINGKVAVEREGALDIGSNEITLGSAQVDGTIKMKIDDLSADSDAYTGGKLKVTNHLELNEASSKLQLTIDAGKLDKETKTGELQLIEAVTSDGEFAQTIANNRYTITSAGNGKYTVEYTQDARETVAEAGGSANNANAAEAWDNVSGLSGAAEEVRQALNDLSQNDAQGYLKALKAVAPTDSRKNLRVVKEVNNLIGNEIARRQEMQGRSSGDAMETTGGWMEVLGNYAKQDSTSDTTGFTGKTAGFALGLDGKVNEETTVAGWAMRLHAQQLMPTAETQMLTDTHCLYTANISRRKHTSAVLPAMGLRIIQKNSMLREYRPKQITIPTTSDCRPLPDMIWKTDIHRKQGSDIYDKSKTGIRTALDSMSRQMM